MVQRHKKIYLYTWYYVIITYYSLSSSLYIVIQVNSLSIHIPPSILSNPSIVQIINILTLLIFPFHHCFSFLKFEKEQGGARELLLIKYFFIYRKILNCQFRSLHSSLENKGKHPITPHIQSTQIIR